MKTAGIIAEYNPFHNGHAYHIRETRRRTQADYIIVVMSGDYVQRGEPALLDKYTRARMALENGADLVLELPAAYACSSAERFACGAVHMLHRLGVVNFLSYGCEQAQEDLFRQLAGLYQKEPEAFSAHLQALLRQGKTYPQARAAATAFWLKDSRIPSLLSSPNNILAVEYHRALLEAGSSIQPVAIRRLGDYHDSRLPEVSQDTKSRYASASAIRSWLLSHKQPEEREGSDLSRQLPQSVMRQLCGRHDFMQADDFSDALYYALLTAVYDNRLSDYEDLTPDLARRIVNHLDQFQSFQSFAERIKTRQWTRVRVNRALLHLLLRITTDKMRQWTEDSYIYYARVLGFQRDSAPLLTAIKQSSSICLLTKMAHARQNLSSFYQKSSFHILKHALELLETDRFASELYEATAAVRFGREQKNECRQGVIITENKNRRRE